LKYTVRAQARFSTNHKADEPARCQMPHGHDFMVIAEYVHEMLDEGIPRGGRGFDERLAQVVGELDGRPLDEMVPGVQHTHVGLAAYIYERMAATFPGLSAVSVRDERGYSGAAFA
jgi:6-pyruvoyl-tetrahydropterin synthase